MEILGVVDVPLPVLLLGTSVILFYTLGKRGLTLFDNYGIPGPKPTLYFGNLREIGKKGLLTSITDWAKEYGNVFGMYMGKVPSVVVLDLDILKEVLVKNFQNFTNRGGLVLVRHPVTTGVFFARGSNWKRIRNIITPTFSAGKLKLLYGRINQCAATLSNNFAKSARTQDTVDVKQYFGGYTMDVITSTAFGIEVDSQNDLSNPFVTHAQNMVSRPQRSLVFQIISVFPSLLSIIMSLRVRLNPQSDLEFFFDAVKEMTKQRKQDKSKNKKVDFLQLLLNAESQTEDKPSEQESDFHGKEYNSGKKLSTDEIIGQSFLFFIAGYETTASTLQFVAYNLATNPDAQEKIIAELDNELGENEPSYENIGKLKYLDCVINETLRLFPPLIGVQREISETVTIKGVTLPKGASVYVPIYQIHHSAENYPDPEDFKPERFLSKSEMNPLAFMPFGYGPRLCIGMRLALIEAKIALVHVIRKVKFVKLEDTPERMEFRRSNFLAPKAPIVLKVQPSKLAA